MNEWTYKNSNINDIEIDIKKYIGFIYKITQISTGKKYIGRKLIYSTTTKIVNGKKKKIKKESDWRNYWSSSPLLKELISTNDLSDFKKEIIAFCSTKGSLVYMEELALYLVGALESDEWFNGNIRSKIYRNWVKKEEAIELRMNIFS